MSVKRTRGEKPQRQLWFDEGIQISELAEDGGGDRIDHIALGADDIAGTVETACENGCQPFPDKAHWFKLPNGISMELMQN